MINDAAHRAAEIPWPQTTAPTAKIAVSAIVQVFYKLLTSRLGYRRFRRALLFEFYIAFTKWDISDNKKKPAFAQPVL